MYSQFLLSCVAIIMFVNFENFKLNKNEVSFCKTIQHLFIFLLGFKLNGVSHFAIGLVKIDLRLTYAAHLIEGEAHLIKINFFNWHG